MQEDIDKFLLPPKNEESALKKEEKRATLIVEDVDVDANNANNDKASFGSSFRMEGYARMNSDEDLFERGSDDPVPAADTSNKIGQKS